MRLTDRINTFGSIGGDLLYKPVYRKDRKTFKRNTQKPMRCPVKVGLCENCPEPDCTFDDELVYQREHRIQTKKAI